MPYFDHKTSLWSTCFSVDFKLLVVLRYAQEQLMYERERQGHISNHLEAPTSYGSDLYNQFAHIPVTPDNPVETGRGEPGGSQMSQVE
jgi:hypothetical protein